MVGFYDLSDTDNESAIEEIISQAQDAVVLDQLSAINCSGFTDSVLPTHLETRFRNLKSFPPSKTKPTIAQARTFSTLSSTNPTNNIHQSPNFSPSKQNPYSQQPSSHQKNDLDEKPNDGSVSVSASASVSVSSPPFGSASVSSPSSDESSLSSIFKPTQKDGSKKDSSLRSSNSPSPPRRMGCLWFSPKKKKKSKEKLGDEFLSELGSFSRKEQQKILKKAMKEEEKVSREAEKIVKWAKQASARFNLEDELSD